jgi:hypothetical protein
MNAWPRGESLRNDTPTGGSNDCRPIIPRSSRRGVRRLKEQAVPSLVLREHLWFRLHGTVSDATGFSLTIFTESAPQVTTPELMGRGPLRESRTTGTQTSWLVPVFYTGATSAPRMAPAVQRPCHFTKRQGPTPYQEKREREREIGFAGFRPVIARRQRGRA